MRASILHPMYIATVIVSIILTAWGALLLQAYFEIRSQVKQLTYDWETNWGQSLVREGEVAQTVATNRYTVALTDGKNYIGGY